MKYKKRRAAQGATLKLLQLGVIARDYDTLTWFMPEKRRISSGSDSAFEATVMPIFRI